MKFIKQKVQDGVLDITQISTRQLIQWSQETDSDEDRDYLGTVIMYDRERIVYR